MANPKRGFVLYFDNYPMIIALPPDQRGWLITALMEYAERLSRGEGLPPEDLLTRANHPSALKPRRPFSSWPQG